MTSIVAAVQGSKASAQKQPTQAIARQLKNEINMVIWSYDYHCVAVHFFQSGQVTAALPILEHSIRKNGVEPQSTWPAAMKTEINRILVAYTFPPVQ